MVSYRVTEREVAALFKEVLKLVPAFDTNFFMSDAAGALFNGFKKALPHSNATRLICMWHWKKEEFSCEHIDVQRILPQSAETQVVAEERKCTC
ncbi:hypothetical protein PENTCL1PPCAC_20380 [Pristionchus entomophagus]|uniref:MULE transposase domain-containing protein n=1 Tax=Pristionchus entomophagus TaxID=358040 RepID=A0AAV5TVB3_9BILA|nr:hypothetical protein PENTCL1PPCAC_20380 [Pristionchus entomophagus]